MPRPPGSREIPPPLELECLRVLWALGEANASRVREALTPGRQLAYTTVLTLLERLTKRGQLSRRKAGRSFIYTPIQDRELMRQTAVAELVNTYFNGESDALLKWLQGVGNHPTVVDRQEMPLDATLL
jgi:BlaI family penicillinase repressor